MKHLIDLIGLLELTTIREPGDRCTPTPTRLALLLKHEEVAEHRSLSCVNYDACLGEALRCGWPSWTCRRCGRFALRGEARTLEIAHEGSRRIV